jgi:hypothetical protein
MDRLAGTSTENDALLIYFAGHGWWDPKSQQGYWLPADAKRDSRGSWIPNAELVGTLRANPARHVLLISDSCFAGSVFGLRDLSAAEQPKDQQAAVRLAEKKSRWVLTSGGNEPVVDGYLASNHSVFAYFLEQVLQERTEVFVNPGAFLDTLQKRVINNAPQSPQAAPIRDAGDEGGQFVMINLTASPPPPPPAIQQNAVVVAINRVPPKVWAGTSAGSLLAAGAAEGLAIWAHARFDHPEDHPGDYNADALRTTANSATWTAIGLAAIGVGTGTLAAVTW